MEHKPPRASPSDGFVKMANCLKGLPRQSHQERCGPFGIDGVRSSLQYKAFAIDLKYHVMYRLIEIGTFYLPRDYNNLDIMLGAKLSWKQHAKKKQFDETAMMVTCVYHHLPPPSIRLAEDQFKFLLQNLDPVRLTHAAQKLDFSNYFHKRIVMVASSAVILSIFTEHHLHCKNVKSWGVFQVMMYRVWVDAAVRSMEQCVD
ncbi:hypothetical protein BCV71DRAFT_268806 [Rhizopus microsporus]|uniref:Uncharacterized protein n=1 Tax=Rhizopus microsporus TaxID=58291 RepID=A0A1X0RLH2_RHIZD|nr:hypothetical protein BCV71DRAFT_268806 [Rhizopus microsporus]